MRTPSDHDTRPIPAPRPFLRDRSFVSHPRLWPLVVFWAGTALFFAMSSMLSAIRFIGILLSADEIWPIFATHHLVWLGAALFLFVCSVISAALSLLVFGRRISGLCGSLVFGLLLTLLAPLAGLLVPQPDYLGVICAGLIPAASVLYTLLNLDSFSG
ncbi:MAG: hypothetical protein ACUVSF_06085 [Anaerolineae bacterium]